MDIAFSLLTPIILGFFLGQHFDSQSSKDFPTWTITGTVLGAVVGFWGVYKRYTL